MAKAIIVLLAWAIFGSVTCAALGGLFWSRRGAIIGAIVGAVLGPVIAMALAYLALVAIRPV